MEQRIGFCRTPGGIRLAYATVGEGPPLVKAANWLSHVEFDLHSPAWRPWLEALSRGRRLVRYDERGCGLSDWDVEFSFEGWVEDLETVVDELGLERFPLLGISQGGPVAIAYAVRHPERVSRLVLYGAYARGWAARDDSPHQRAEAEALLTLTRQGWGRDNPAYRQVFTSLFCPDASPEQARWFNELQRVSTSPENAVRFLRTFGTIDVADLLPRVEVPTLVLHARREERVPLAEGRLIADSIPGARFVPLDSRNHILLEHEPAWKAFRAEVESFLAEDAATVTVPGGAGGGSGWSAGVGGDGGREGSAAVAGGTGSLTPERWSRVQELFLEALERERAERPGYVRDCCAGDRALLGEVLSLLEAHEEEGLLGTPDRAPADVEAAASAPGGGRAEGGARSPGRGTPGDGRPGAGGAAPGPATDGRMDPHEALHAELGDRYELEDVLGEGGMGTVYRARDRKHGRVVAIKTIHPDLALGEGLHRFEREIQVTAGLQHPHVLPLIDSGTAGGFLYYIMPFVEGESLRERLARDGRIAVADAVRIGRDVLEGLEHAHARGVVHRDIKPGNILLAERHAVIADFGIAKALAGAGADDTLTRSGVAIGTPRYMAPEQLAGEATGQSDLYALGAVLYEAITGQRWQPGSSTESIDWAGVPLALRPVLQRALRSSPADRWPDAAAFRRALGRVEGAGRRRSGVVAAAVLVLLLAAATFWGWSRDGGAATGDRPPAGSIAVLPFVNLTGDAENEYFSDGITDDILTTLTKIGELRVISRTSVMPYKESQKSLRQIGEELGVATILEGSVRREGDRVRISAQLVDARTDEHLWAETYDRELTTTAIFEIQSEIARDIAGALRTRLSEADRERLARQPPATLRAYDLYLKGTERLRRAAHGLADTRQLVEGASLLLRESLSLDPGYAPAHAALSETYSLRIFTDGPEWADSALAAGWRALQLDPELAEAYAAIGNVHHWKGENGEALANFQRALELNPSSAPANRLAASSLHMMGRWDEALTYAVRAVALEPTVGGHYEMVGRIYQDLGMHEEAESWYRRRLRLEPENASTRAWLAYVHMLRGDDAAAAATLDTALTLAPTSVRGLMMAYILELRRGDVAAARTHVEDLMAEVADRFQPLVTYGYVLWKAGERQEAERWLGQAEARSREGIDGLREVVADDYVDMARIAATRGDLEAGIGWLRQAVANGWRDYQYARMDPRLEALRGDGRFRILLAEMEREVATMRSRLREEPLPDGLVAGEAAAGSGGSP